MSTPTASTFVFYTCQPGGELPLKQELAARDAELRLAFSRPGFVSFKSSRPAGSALAGPLPVFARAAAVSLGRVAGDHLLESARRVWELNGVRNLLRNETIRALHVWQRDTLLPGDNDFEPAVTPLAEEVRRAVLSAAHQQESPPKAAQLETTVAPVSAGVLDIVLVEPNEWYVGWHRANSRGQRWPGGIMPIAAPPEMVSRAYLKMQEALKWSALPATRGDVWVELGCAPGGASQALLEHGYQVIGVDPAEVADAVAHHPRFTHLRKRAAEVRRVEFAPATWLAADLNVAPQYTLDAVQDIVAHPSTSIRGLVLTLKLASWDVATPERLAAYVERVKGWGFRDVRLRQLVHNRRELCLVALHSRGQRRMKRRKKSLARTDEGARPEAQEAPSSELRFDAPLRILPRHHFR